MSSDYRPRGGSEGGSRSGAAAGGGGRRRRGGRGRSGPNRGGSHTENRVHTNGGSSSAPKKEQSLFAKWFGWLSPKKKPETKPPFRSSTTPAAPRTEYKERTPGAERTDRAERAEHTERPERTERPRREDRPPKAESTPQEIVSPKLYVGNLAYEAAESDLHDLFSKVGLVKNVEVAMDRHSGRSKGFGFVEMESLDTAKEAAAKLNRTDFMSRQIVVSGAKVDKRPAPSNPREADPTSPEAEVTAAEPEPQHEPKPEAGSSSSDATA
jgi:RNA recognition motif-containing protein